MKTNEEQAKKAAIEAIAKKILGLETLDERKSDGLDFSEQAVWRLEAALAAAYEAGADASRGVTRTSSGEKRYQLRGSSLVVSVPA